MYVATDNSLRCPDSVTTVTPTPPPTINCMSTADLIRNDTMAKLMQVLCNQPLLLVGSRATGKAHDASDWDNALQWSPEIDWMTVLAHTESLRNEIAHTPQTAESDIDRIDFRRANLAMRANVAEEGLILTGEDTSAWARFLRRTWRDLEDFYWDQQHAA